MCQFLQGPGSRGLLRSPSSAPLVTSWVTVSPTCRVCLIHSFIPIKERQSEKPIKTPPTSGPATIMNICWWGSVYYPSCRVWFIVIQYMNPVSFSLSLSLSLSFFTGRAGRSISGDYVQYPLSQATEAIHCRARTGLINVIMQHVQMCQCWCTAQCVSVGLQLKFNKDTSRGFLASCRTSKTKQHRFETYEE